ncbi:hypothetical protein AB9K24_00355 [Meridianimaribacter flavus]
MTVQAQESLEYRDEKYSLIGAPLHSYLENHKEIEFEMYTTAHWRGYQGYWLLQDNKLYLTNIESANYTIQDLFKTDKPVLADWFSGQLEFGVGDFHHDHWWGFYDNYVWLNIENGKVVEKKIIKRFSEEIEFKFGKYKGKKLEEVINGKIQRNTYTTIKDFAICLLEFIRDKEFAYKVQSPHFKVTEQDVELVREIRDYGVEYFLTQNFIATSSKVFWENSNEDERASNLSILLEKIFRSDFTKPFTLTKQNLENAETAEQSILINGDLQYLNWALKTVEFFTIPPNQLEKEFALKRLKNLSIKRLNDFVFEYEPVLETIKYRFSENIINLNREKFEKINKVKYDSENQFYLPNLTESELMNEFGHYLDEDHIEQEVVDFDNYQYQHDDYYYDPDDWLRDAAGTDDPEVMNDVYWNLD